MPGRDRVPHLKPPIVPAEISSHHVECDCRLAPQCPRAGMKLSGCHFDCRTAAIGGSRSSQYWGALDSASREAHTRFAGFAAPEGGWCFRG
jgi:hypothetical protein